MRIKFVRDITMMALAAFNAFSQGAVGISYVSVGNAGNPADPASNGKLGAVATTYAIGKYEVTIAQYVEFLNSVDAGGANTRALYNPKMDTDANGGISLVAGNANGGKYVVKPGHANNPVVYVSWFDAARMANWLSNGQGNASTETGAYTLTGNATITGGRSANAQVFLPAESEWYKAAYYQPASAGGDTDNYWLYPTRMNTEPTGDAPAGGPNSANFYGLNGYAVTQSPDGANTLNYLTDVGAYSTATSYYGTFDQGGNVEEWNETTLDGNGRNLRGGSWILSSHYLRADVGGAAGATFEGPDLGFRLAAIPEPGLAAILGLIGLSLSRRRVVLK